MLQLLMKHPIFWKRLCYLLDNINKWNHPLAWTLNQLNLRRFSVGCHSNGNLAKVHDRKWCRCHHPCLRERVGCSATFGILGSGRSFKWCLVFQTGRTPGKRKGWSETTTWSLTDLYIDGEICWFLRLQTNIGSFTCCWDDGFISSSWLIFICWYYLCM